VAGTAAAVARTAAVAVSRTAAAAATAKTARGGPRLPQRRPPRQRRRHRRSHAGQAVMVCQLTSLPLGLVPLSGHAGAQRGWMGRHLLQDGLRHTC
jgi:hypothetical protein